MWEIPCRSPALVSGWQLTIPRVSQVKNKAPAEIQITAEQLLREAKERELEIVARVSCTSVKLVGRRSNRFSIIYFSVLEGNKCCPVFSYCGQDCRKISYGSRPASSCFFYASRTHFMVLTTNNIVSVLTGETFLTVALLKVK